MVNARGLFKLLFKAPVSIFKLVCLIRKEKFDLVHTNTGVTLGGAFAAAVTRTPHVWHFREVLSEFGFFLQLHQPLVRLLSRRIIFITAAVQDQFNSDRLKQKGIIIHDGINIQNYEVGQESDDGQVVITTVGRLASYKGQNVLLEALAKAKAGGLGLKAYIVGDIYGNRFAFRDSLKRQAKELLIEDCVFFTGFQTDIRPFLEKCNLFILPSVRPEGLGIVILEAMAAKRAVIASDSGSAREVINHQEDGFLVPPGDSDSMATAILKLANDQKERHRLAASGKAKVAHKFSEEIMVGAVMALYDDVLGSQSGMEC